MSDSETSAEMQGLVRQLYEPRTRRAARQQLVAAKAVETLLECLHARNESVVWAAVESLEELRATEAVEPLIELLERGVLVLDVSEALSVITGHDHGVDTRQWRAWLAESDAGEPPEEFDAAECIGQTGELLGVEPTGSGKSFRFKLSLSSGRSQKVDVYFGREDTAGDPLVVVYSECGPAVPKFYESVLRKNISIPSGAFAIRDVGGKPHFVMVDTMLAAMVTPSTLAKKIEHIGSRADMVEKALTKEDTR